MTKDLRILTVAMFVVASPHFLFAQRFQVGAQVSSVSGSEFDGADVGVGGRLSWSPISLVGLEGEVTFYPGDYPDAVPYSAGRTEYFVGATLGPKLGPIRPFVRVRAGGLDIQAAAQPFVCLAIFPPTLACSLGAGENLTAYDFGGGLEVFPSSRTFFRVDVGDRMLKYPGPVMRPGGKAATNGFYGNEFRLAAGGGFRF